MPMTLSLYKRGGTNVYLNYFHWFPHLEQWWITGFVPNIYDYSISAEKLIHISSVDLSKYPEMIDSINNSQDLLKYESNSNIHSFQPSCKGSVSLAIRPQPSIVPNESFR